VSVPSLKDFLESDNAKHARKFNDQLWNTLKSTYCPYCDCLLSHPGQTHVCKSVPVGAFKV
jgi:hypothetical protein